jgi:hypothetical protein
MHAATRRCKLARALVLMLTQPAAGAVMETGKTKHTAATPQAWVSGAGTHAASGMTAGLGSLCFSVS